MFSWHALITELSTVLRNDAISTTAEAQSSREKIAKVFRDRPSIDFLKGNDSLWEPLKVLYSELEMRQIADQQAQQSWQGDTEVLDAFGCNVLWQTF